MQKRKYDNIAFAVNITPDKRTKTEEEDDAIAVLAPFNPFPKVSFDRVKLNKRENRTVILKNPTNHPIQVELSKLPDNARGFQWSFTSCELPRESDSKLNICWTPIEYGSWRDNIKIVNTKTKKIVCEIIIISSTEEPPKISGRASRLKALTCKVKKPFKTMTCKNSENKENQLENVLKQPLNKVCKQATNHNKAPSVLSSDSVSNSVTSYSNDRRVTYDILSPSTSTYSLRQKQLSSIADLEQERLIFENIASPGLHNASIDKAAIKLVENEASHVGKTFTIPPTCSLDVIKPPQRRTTYEVLPPPASITKPPVLNTNNEGRFSLDSLEDIYGFDQIGLDNITDFCGDALKVVKQPFDNSEKYEQQAIAKNTFISYDLKTKNNRYFDTNYVFSEQITQLQEHSTEQKNNIDFDAITILCDDAPEIVDHQKNNHTEECDRIKNSNDTFTLTDSITSNEGDLNGYSYSASSQQLTNQVKENSKEQKMQMLSRSDETYDKVDIKHQLGCNHECVQLTGTISKPDISHFIFDMVINKQPENEVEYGRKVFNMDKVNTMTIGNPEQTSKCYTITDKVIENACSTHIKRNVSDHSDIESVITCDHNIKDKDQHSNNYQHKEVSVLSNETPCSSFLESGDNTLAKVKISTPVHSTSSLSAQAGDIASGKAHRALIWDISPPAIVKTPDIVQPKKEFLTPKIPANVLSMKSLVLSQFPDVLPSKSKVALKDLIKVGNNSTSICSSNVTEQWPTSTSTAHKRLMSLPSSSMGSQPKMRRIAQSVKRLATPKVKKAIVSSMTDMKKKSLISTHSIPRSTSYSSLPRKSVRVTEWMPVRKLRLSSTDSNSSPVQASVELGDAPDPFIAATTLNPFAEGCLYFSEEWLKAQQEELLRWAHLMLQPPLELQLDRVHSQRSTLPRLNGLRVAAYNLLVSPPVATILVKVKAAVEKGIINIRRDKQLHADIGLQEIVVRLLMSYNPLWLRLCLEAVFQCTIHLKCHSDAAGLTSFIRRRIISDDTLLQAHSHPTIPHLMMPEFEAKMKKFTLYKFLVLVYLLDLAKCKKLILHDPCLFKKESKIKSSKVVLIEFNKEFIAGAGDITKMLRVRGYEVSHAQNYLDEFDFSLNCISELRDGVRLTKLAETLVGDNTLCSKLRVPAISSLQKKHNAEVAFTALEKAGYKIPEDINPKHISDGHKEKTLSFLWHLRGIIQNRAVSLIILKWRQMKLVKRDRAKFLKMKNSAIKIQRWYRKTKYLILNKEELEANKKEREMFLKLRSTAVLVQRTFRKKIDQRMKRKMIEAATVIQKWYRYRLNHKKGNYPFKKIQKATITIQRAYRMYQKKKEAHILIERIYFTALKKTVKFVQATYRKKLCLKREKQLFVIKGTASIKLQSYFISNYISTPERMTFIKLKLAALTIQIRFRAKRLGLVQRRLYLGMRFAVLLIQRKLRATLLARKDRTKFLEVKSAALAVQRIYRMKCLGQVPRRVYLRMRSAALLIQRKLRATLLARKTRQQFLRVKSAALIVQRRYKAKCLAQGQRCLYLKMGSAALLIQRKLRATLLARKTRQQFLQVKSAALTLQRRYRAMFIGRVQRSVYLRLRSSVLLIQRKLRATLIARKNRQHFLQRQERALRDRTNAVIKIQALWRGRMVRRNLILPRPQRIPPNIVSFRDPVRSRGQKCFPVLRNFSKHSVGEMLAALNNLDKITILSPDQCNHFASCGAVEKLFAFLATTNKLKGIDRCIELSLMILCNLYKAPNVSSTVWEETLRCTGITQSVELCLKFRLEKTTSVFCKAATLIWLFAQVPGRAAIIMKCPKVSNMLAYIGKCMDKAVPLPPQTNKQARTKKLPSTKPNWGNYFNQARSFDDKRHAWESLKGVLQLTK